MYHYFVPGTKVTVRRPYRYNDDNESLVEAYGYVEHYDDHHEQIVPIMSLAPLVEDEEVSDSTTEENEDTEPPF
jgi:hypothetical protein